MSRRTKAETSAARDLAFAEELVARLRGRLAAGAESAGELRVQTVLGEDLVVDIKLSVRRAVSFDQRQDYRAKAMDELRARPSLARKCQCNTKGGRYMNCSYKVAAAVVVGPTCGLDKKPWFKFICGQHRKAPGIRREAVLGIVDLLEAELAPLRLRADREDAEAARKAEAERKARFAAAIGPFADPAGMPEGWTYSSDNARGVPIWRVERGGLRLSLMLTEEADVYWRVTQDGRGRDVEYDLIEDREDVRRARAKALVACLQAEQQLAAEAARPA